MKKEDKEILLKDLCARLCYRPTVLLSGKEHCILCGIDGDEVYLNIDSDPFNVKSIKPYLRPMSSMTEEERIEFSRLLVKRYCEEDCEGHISTSYCIEIDNVYTDDENRIKYPSSFSMDAIDWLNANYFDYRGLIDKGLALEALEGMY